MKCFTFLFYTKSLKTSVCSILTAYLNLDRKFLSKCLTVERVGSLTQVVPNILTSVPITDPSVGFKGQLIRIKQIKQPALQSQ